MSSRISEMVKEDSPLSYKHVVLVRGFCLDPIFVLVHPILVRKI